MRCLISQSLCLIAALVMLSSPALADGPQITALSGDVEIGRGEPPVWRNATEGDALAAGDSIRVGSAARAELDLGKGTIRLYENSLLRLPADAFGSTETTAVELGQGGSLFDIDKSKNHEGFEVRTPEAVVMVKGTRFSVSVAGTDAAVSVFRGLVGVRGLTDTLQNEVLVRQGFTAIGGAGSFNLKFDRSPDPWRSWNKEQLKDLPIPQAVKDKLQPPAAIAVDEARAEALSSMKPEVLKTAMERNPEFKRAVAERMREMAKEGKLAEKLEDQEDAMSSMSPEMLEMLEMKGMDPSDPKVRHEIAKRIQHRMADKMVTGSPDEEVREQMQDLFMDYMMQNGGGPAGGGTPMWDVVEVTTGGPNLLKFVNPNTGTTAFTVPRAQIDSILASGDATSLPGPLLTALGSAGIPPMMYVQMLDQTYF